MSVTRGKGASLSDSEETGLVTSMTKKEIKKIIADSVAAAVKAALAVEVSKLKDFVKTEISKAVEPLETQIFDLKQENDNLNEQLNSTTETLEDLKHRMDKNEINTREALIHANYNEQYSRRKSVRITGLLINDTENCKEVACKLFKDELDVDVDQGSIMVAHRVGKEYDGKRDLLVKFMNRGPRDKVLAKRRALKGKQKAIKEDLTRKNAQLMNRVTNHEGVKSCWSKNGQIWAVGESDGAHKFRIELFDDINELLARHSG